MAYHTLTGVMSHATREKPLKGTRSENQAASPAAERGVLESSPVDPQGVDGGHHGPMVQGNDAWFLLLLFNQYLSIYLSNPI